MSELVVVLIGVLAFGGSILRKLRQNRRPRQAESGQGKVGGQPQAATSAPEPLANLNPPGGRLAVPVEPPDPLVVAVCAAMPVEVTSVRLRSAAGIKTLY